MRGGGAVVVVLGMVAACGAACVSELERRDWLLTLDPTDEYSAVRLWCRPTYLTVSGGR